jgi:hypothetical protein
VFSFSSFIVLGLTFKSLTHFMLTFVLGERLESTFILPYVYIQLLFTEKTIFPPVYVLEPFSKMSGL